MDVINPKDRAELIKLGLKKRDKDDPFDITWRDLGEQFGISETATRDIVRKYAKKHGLLKTTTSEESDLPGYKSVVELNKDGSHTSDKLLKMSAEQAKDPEYLLLAHGYSVKDWELVSARNNIWNVYSKQDGIQVLYSSRIVARPREEYQWNPEDIAAMFDNLGKIKTAPKCSITTPLGDDLLVVAVADLHYNLLADLYSTGNTYNTEIAKELYFAALNDIVQRVQNQHFKKVLFVVGNDFVNADNISGTTTKGTPQDNQSAWFGIINEVTQLVVEGIDLLINIAPVDVVYVPSNHDLHTMFGVMKMVKMWYRQDQRVTVDESPLPRKYYVFEKTLIGLAHDIKIKDALRIMTSEAKDKWSNCNNMIWLLAHLHQAMTYEKQGYMEVYRLPTISGWSRWSNSMGYVQTEKKNQSFIVSGELGIMNVINTVLR